MDLREMLENLGYKVLRVASAAEASEYLKKGGRADLVMTDIVMPGTHNGLDLARAVRDRHPGLPVLLTTGYSAAAREAMQDGFPLLSKPYQTSTLQRLIGNALGQRSRTLEIN